MLGIVRPDSMSITFLIYPMGEVAIAVLHKEKSLLDEELSDEGASED